MSDWMENLDKFRVNDIADYYLSMIVIFGSLAYIALEFHMGASGTTLSMVFYTLLPVSLALIVYQSYKISDLIYRKFVEEGDGEMNELIVGVVIGVASLNLGFMTVVTSGPAIIKGQQGMYKFVMLMVVLSFSLAIGLLADYTEIYEI